MPEDSNPGFTSEESEMRLRFFTLPMSLNYQRDSYKLWEAATKSYNDPEIREIFDLSWVARTSSEELRKKLLTYKVGLQPNKHVSTWKTIATTISQNWGSITNLLTAADHDFLKVRTLIQEEHKRGFPYLSGPKIFNYWSFVIQSYGKINLKNTDFIDIAPDTHITKCSVLLGVITESEATSLSRDEISERWRVALLGSGINPIHMHSPLWFWSRNGFIYSLPG